MQVHRLLGAVVPRGLAQRFGGERLQRAHALDRLDQQRLAPPLHLEQRAQAAPERRHQQPDDERDQRGEAQHDGGERARVEQQHRHEHEERGGVDRRHEQAPGEELPDPLGLLHVARDDAGRARLEEVDRQREQPRKGAAHEPEVDALGGVDQQVLAQELEACLEQDRQHHPGREGEQRRARLVWHHAVDHELQEDRDRERQQVQQHRGERQVAEVSPLAPELRHEPAQPERLRFVEQRERAAQQQRLAVPGLGELAIGQLQHHACRARERVAHQHRGGTGPSPASDEQHEVAVAQPQDRRQPRFDLVEPLDAALPGARRETLRLGQPREAGRVVHPAGRRGATPQVARIGVQPMVRRDPGEALAARALGVEHDGVGGARRRCRCRRRGGRPLGGARRGVVGLVHVWGGGRIDPRAGGCPRPQGRGPAFSPISSRARCPPAPAWAAW